MADDFYKDSNKASFSLYANEEFFRIVVLMGVLVGVFVCTEDNCLANEVEYIEIIAEMPVSRFEVLELSSGSNDCGVVVGWSVEYKETQLITSNVVTKERCWNGYVDSLACMSTYEMQQVIRQVVYYSSGVIKMRNSSKKDTLAALSCPAIESCMNLI
jgi:hypothetical protein